MRNNDTLSRLLGWRAFVDGGAIHDSGKFRVPSVDLDLKSCGDGAKVGEVGEVEGCVGATGSPRISSAGKPSPRVRVALSSWRMRFCCGEIMVGVSGGDNGVDSTADGFRRRLTRFRSGPKDSAERDLLRVGCGERLECEDLGDDKEDTEENVEVEEGDLGVFCSLGRGLAGFGLPAYSNGTYMDTGERGRRGSVREEPTLLPIEDMLRVLAVGWL